MSSPLTLAAPHVRALPVLKAEQARRRSRNRLAIYEPYPKQAAFHVAGAQFRERLFLAGNQVGKTWAGAFELAIHSSGLYPAWWKGRRWDRPIVAWVAGITGESTRDNPQRLLMGRPGQFGTGAIPGDRIVDTSRAQGVADLLDTVRVAHARGGESLIAVKSYEKGREKWQGETIDLVWFDEEPPADIYSEGLTRTNATGGLAYLTCTPLLGMTQVIAQFMQTPTADRHVTQMTIDDADHYTPEDRARIIASYAAHEREARTKGIPVLGSGRIFPVPEESIAEPAPILPAHWPRLVGLDFGWDHPTAAVWVAWDRDADTMHVYDCYRAAEQTPIVHAAALRARGDWIPVSWPQDGLQHDKGSGERLAQLYREQRVAMLAAPATFPDGGNSVEAGLAEMLDRMKTGRLKVAAHLADWFQEFRLYHRKDGRVVKLQDDLLCATRYAMMMLRAAKTQLKRNTTPRERHAPGSWMG